MSSSSSSSNKLTVVFIGDADSGKSSVVESIVDAATDQVSTESSAADPYIQEVNFSVGTQDISLQLIDTEESDDLSQRCVLCDMVVLVLDQSSAESSLRNKWLQVLLTDVRKPFCVLLNKCDLMSEEEQIQDQSNIEDIVEELLKYGHFIGSMRYSAKTRQGVAQLVARICSLFSAPLEPLLDIPTQRLTARAEIAFRRIFYIVDSDNDRLWSVTELGRFLRKCDGLVSSLEQVNDLIGAEDASLVRPDGVTLEGMLVFCKQLVKSHYYLKSVWDILFSFDYNLSLDVDIDDMLNNFMPKVQPEEYITLSAAGISVVEQLFKQLDTDHDGLLGTEDIDYAFSILPEHPFKSLSPNYLEMVETKASNRLTMSGWTSLWCLLTLRDPFVLLQALLFWGQKKASILARLFDVKLRRSARSKDPIDAPSTVNCYIFGAPRSGKSSLLRSMIGKPFDVTSYSRTESAYTAVGRVQLPGGKGDVYLAMTEFSDDQVQSVLRSEELMSSCDICALCFDANDKYSFSNIAYIQKALPRDMPVVYIVTKIDLEVVEQEFAVTPQEFCEQLQLPWPCTISSLVKHPAARQIEIFQEIAALAQTPELALPNFDFDDEEADDDDESDDEDDEDGSRKKSSSKSSSRSSSSASQSSKFIKIALVAGIVGVLGVAVWKFALSKKASGK